MALFFWSILIISSSFFSLGPSSCSLALTMHKERVQRARAAACHVGSCQSHWSSKTSGPPGALTARGAGPCWPRKPITPAAASHPTDVPACRRFCLRPEPGSALWTLRFGSAEEFAPEKGAAGGDLCSGYFLIPPFRLAGFMVWTLSATSPSAFARSKGWRSESLKTAGFCWIRYF